MAKITIREGSLEVALEGDGGLLVDKCHARGGPVDIAFETYGTNYTFREGKPVRAISFGKIAGTVILLWGVAIAVLWFWVSLRSVLAGQGLANVPAGLAAVVAALTAGGGWNRYLVYRERTRHS